MQLLVFLALSIQRSSTATHTLEYILTGVTPGFGFPEFSAVGHVDGSQGGYYDSNIKKVILRGEWIKENKNVAHWNLLTEMAHDAEEIFKAQIANLMKRLNQTEGIHTWQRMLGCELHDDGTKKGYMRYGYDGEDYISLDLKTVTWIAANDKAVPLKLTWEKEGYASQKKYILENLCIEYLKKYVESGTSILERKVPPEVSLFQKDFSSPVVCHATGFFPKAMMISWQKNGEDLHEDVELRETLPNQDGTFQKRSVLTVSPEELDRNQYTCVVQHSSLEKEMVLQVSDHIGNGSLGIITGSAVAVLLIAIIGCVGVLVCKKLRKYAFQPVSRTSTCKFIVRQLYDKRLHINVIGQRRK
ncbi:hypothetical protein MHYP_G00262460 [Metynnis hypsauchen]